MVRHLWREMVESSCAHDDRHRTHAQRRRLRPRIRRFDRRELHAGRPHCADQPNKRLVRSQARACLLVRICLHGIRDHFPVLRIRNESVAAYLHRHGPATARHGTQRSRPRRLAQARVGRDRRARRIAYGVAAGLAPAAAVAASIFVALIR